MEERNEIITVEGIRNRVYMIRGMQVMLDSDLAEIYGYDVKRLNEQKLFPFRGISIIPFCYAYILIFDS